MERVSLADQVVAAVRDDILAGLLSPGESLREQALSERFEVGRSTVREAIKVLASEGLVSQAHHRGAVVRRHTAADVDDLIAARLMVERQLAAGPLGDTSAARDALADMQAAVAAGDWQAAARADERFHHGLVAALGSPRIRAFHAGLQAELRLLLLRADRDRFEEDKVEEHRRLLDLLLAGDADGYVAAAVRHVTRSRGHLLHVAGAADGANGAAPL